jgi:hypothetical protein
MHDTEESDRLLRFLEALLAGILLVRLNSEGHGSQSLCFPPDTIEMLVLSAFAASG